MRRLVHFFIVNVCFSQGHSIHVATDIHTHYVGHCLICDGHGGADGAALAGMDIRHDPDLRSFGHGVIAHAPYLLNGIVLHHCRVADCCIYFSFDLYHILHPLSALRHCFS